MVDSNNTSGFGKDGKIPLVAIFTFHDPKGEKEGSVTFQNQSIAYSLDEGQTWTKYANNPVLKNPGIKDFRDPKVSWYEPGKKWIMTLATLDRITFYSSKDLKNWTKEWRGATTIPLELHVEKIDDKYYLASQSVKELEAIQKDPVFLQNFPASDYSITVKPGPFKLSIATDTITSCNIILSNDVDEKLDVAFEKFTNEYFVTRRAAGNSSFDPTFASMHKAPRLTRAANADITLLVDRASIELFADNGLTVMTEICFPSQPWTKVSLLSEGMIVKELRYIPLKGIWE